MSTPQSLPEHGVWWVPDLFRVPGQFIHFRLDASEWVPEIRSGWVCSGMNSLIFQGVNGGLMEAEEGAFVDGDFLGVPCQIQKVLDGFIAVSSQQTIGKVWFRQVEGLNEPHQVKLDISVPVERIFATPPPWAHLCVGSRISGFVRKGSLSDLYLLLDFKNGTRIQIHVSDVGTPWNGGEDTSRRTLEIQRYIYRTPQTKEFLDFSVYTSVTGKSVMLPINKIDRIAVFCTRLKNIVLPRLSASPRGTSEKFTERDAYWKLWEFEASIVDDPLVDQGFQVRIESGGLTLVIALDPELRCRRIFGDVMEGDTKVTVNIPFCGGKVHGRAEYESTVETIVSHYDFGLLHDCWEEGRAEKAVPAYTFNFQEQGSEFGLISHYHRGKLNGSMTLYTDKDSNVTYYSSGLEHRLGGDVAHGMYVTPSSFRNVDVTTYTTEEANEFLHSLLLKEFMAATESAVFHPFFWTWIRYRREGEMVHVEQPDAFNFSEELRYITLARFSLAEEYVFVRPRLVNFEKPIRLGWDSNRGGFFGGCQFPHGVLKIKKLGNRASVGLPVGVVWSNLQGALFQRILDEGIRASFGLESFPPHLLSFVALLVASRVTTDPRYQGLFEKGLESSLRGISQGVLKSLVQGLRETPGGMGSLESFTALAQAESKGLHPSSVTSLCGQDPVEVKNEA